MDGGPYTVLKPAGLDIGPVIPMAEAIYSGPPDDLADHLPRMVRHEVQERFKHIICLKRHAPQTSDAVRAYVSAMLGLQVWSHKV